MLEKPTKRGIRQPRIMNAVVIEKSILAVVSVE